ncbi:hypothetical protein IWX77_003257 [Cryobacterium sp. CAN_C2]
MVADQNIDPSGEAARGSNRFDRGIQPREIDAGVIEPGLVGLDDTDAGADFAQIIGTPGLGNIMRREVLNENVGTEFRKTTRHGEANTFAA